MSILNKIRKEFPQFVDPLARAGFQTDSDLRLLDGTDLRELVPGIHNLWMIRCLLEIIHNEPSACENVRPSHEDEALMEKIKEFSPEAARALKENGCYSDFHLLDRTDLLRLFPGEEKLKLRKKIFEIIKTQNQSQSTVWKMKNSMKGLSSNITVWDRKEVNFQILDSGKSLSVYKQVIKKVTSKMGVDFSATSSNPKVSLLFCPIISRIQSDAEAAVARIQDDKPVILVFLIHSFKAQPVSLMRSWDYSKIVLHVFLFHHETKSGLLSCKENNKAISDIQNKLLEYREGT